MWTIRIGVVALMLTSTCAVSNGQQLQDEAAERTIIAKLDEILSRLDSLERRFEQSRPDTQPTHADPRHSRTSPVFFGPERDERVYAAVYNVADLVLPLGTSHTEGKVRADFDSVIHRITSQIRPDSWDTVGGSAAIESFPTNLSLMVSQTREGHTQVSSLLTLLRVEARMAQRLKELERRISKLERDTQN